MNSLLALKFLSRRRQTHEEASRKCMTAKETQKPAILHGGRTVRKCLWASCLTSRQHHRKSLFSVKRVPRKGLYIYTYIYVILSYASHSPKKFRHYRIGTYHMTCIYVIRGRDFLKLRTRAKYNRRPPYSSVPAGQYITCCTSYMYVRTILSCKASQQSVSE